MTTCSFPTISAVKSSFKSERAAQMAVTKANGVYDMAVRNGCTDEYKNYEGAMSYEENGELRTKVEAHRIAAHAALIGLVSAAAAQGFSTRSSWLEHDARNARIQAGYRAPLNY